MRAVEVGRLDLPGGSVPSVDIMLGTPVGAFRLQLFVVRKTRLVFGAESVPVIERFVAELRTTLGVQV